MIDPQERDVQARLFSREKHERGIISANYSAVEIHGFFGLIDDG